MDERIQRLRWSRLYCEERLIEVKGEIARLQDEGLVLKARIETAPDLVAEGRIRSRRRFLSRRIDELKAERAALTRELDEVNAQLTGPVEEDARNEQGQMATVGS